MIGDGLETASQVSEERLRLALNAGGLASWDWNLRTGEMGWSAALYRVYGYRYGEVEPGFDAWLDRVHPDDRASALETLHAARANRTEYISEYRSLHPDGTVRYCAARGVFHYDDQGQAVRMIGVMDDVTEAKEAERALRESDARFRQFGEASSDVLWIRNAETLELEYLSSAFDRIYGMSREEMLRQPTLDSWIKLIDPEDRHSVYAGIADVRAGKRTIVEYRIRRPSDGQVRWMRNTKFPLLDEHGVVVRIGGIGHDATEEREASDRLQVLVAELQHRTRNLIAVVNSIAERTLHECATLDEFREAYSSRLAAIARVQGLLSRLTDGDKVSFDDLLREELKAHGANPDQIDLRGPPGVKLRSTTLQTFALALHELATNAIKYGALSTAGGRLSVHWEACPWADGSPALCVEWRESGVRRGAAPSRRPGGYGRELIEKALPYQLKAKTLYELQPDGLLCKIDVPLAGSA